MTRYAVHSAQPWKDTDRVRVFCVADDRPMAELMCRAEQAATHVEVAITPVDQLPVHGTIRVEAA